MLLRISALGLALALLLQHPALVQAQDAASVTRARAALHEGDSARAIAILEAEQATSADPELLYELYFAHHQAGHLERAAFYLEAYLEEEPERSSEELDTLRVHLRDLRASLVPVDRGPDREAMTIAGWTLLVSGIAGVLTFAIGGAAAESIESGLPDMCRADARLCAPGSRESIDTAWIVAWSGLGAGVVLGTIGAILLFLAGEHAEGATPALPPDLDPSVQRSVSLEPWIGEANGMRLTLQF